MADEQPPVFVDDSDPVTTEIVVDLDRCPYRQVKLKVSVRDTYRPVGEQLVKLDSLLYFASISGSICIKRDNGDSLRLTRDMVGEY